MFDQGQLYFIVVGAIFLMIVSSVIGFISRLIEKKECRSLKKFQKV